MYTDEDLFDAIKAGILERDKVERFRDYVATRSETSSVDEENFRLLSGFNDIFVSIAASVLLISVGWLFGSLAPVFGFLSVAVVSWFLSEFFILRRRLALPAILLLISFVVSSIIFSSSTLEAYGFERRLLWGVSCAVGAFSAWLHWVKFKVPVTVAMGTASLAACILIYLYSSELNENLADLIVFSIGLAVFVYAMSWDSQDRERKSRKSDVAFWLHLVASPLIVHPVFSFLGILDAEDNNFASAMVIFMYMFLVWVSIFIDRRALMVSSLVYVLYAFNELFSSFGMIGAGLAVAGIVIGSTLLILSAFWQASRMHLLRLAPDRLLRYVPPA